MPRRGAQFKDVGAVHATFLLQRAETDAGLLLMGYGGSVTWEHILGRVRLGIGMRWQYNALERATASNELTHAGAGPTTFLSVDIVQSKHANLFIGLHGDLTALPDFDPLPGLWLNIGGRFKAP